MQNRVPAMETPIAASVSVNSWPRVMTVIALGSEALFSTSAGQWMCSPALGVPYRARETPTCPPNALRARRGLDGYAASAADTQSGSLSLRAGTSDPPPPHARHLHRPNI